MSVKATNFAGDGKAALVRIGVPVRSLGPVRRLLVIKGKQNMLDNKLRVSEVAGWIEFQVLPMRVKRGRG